MARQLWKKKEEEKRREGARNSGKSWACWLEIEDGTALGRIPSEEGKNQDGGTGRIKRVSWVRELKIRKISRKLAGLEASMRGFMMLDMELPDATAEEDMRLEASEAW